MSGGVIVVGGSVAGIRTARALREQGYAGPVRVVEAEDELPYDKPPLSKLPLGADAHVPLLTQSEAAELGIDLVLGLSVTALRPDTSEIVLDDGSVMEFDHLVVATGARARPAPWALEGVHVLRGLADARAIRDGLASSSSLLVIGAGFIGAEVAALARKHGIEVTIVDAAEVPMARVAGDELGQRLSDLHRINGVKTVFGVTVSGIDRDGSTLRAVLSDGSEVRADSIVVGIGAELNIEWLETSGLPLVDGVECDEHGRVRGFTKIYAVGDVARWRRPSMDVSARIEHWTNAVEQANCVAQNIVHPDELVSHDPVAYVWSDQYDWHIHLFGTRPSGVQPEIVEEAEPFRLAATWRDGDGVVLGGLTINWTRESVKLRKAIAARNAAARVDGTEMKVASA